MVAAYQSLDKDRWGRARADAAALVVRHAYRLRQDAGEARPQDDMAKELCTAQPGISRSVKRGDVVLKDPDRLRDAHMMATAAGIDPELLS